MYISKNEVCSVNLLKSPCQKNYYPIRLVASYLLAARLARASNVRRTMRHSVSEDCVKAAKTTYLLRASAPNQTRFAGLRFGIGIFSVKLRQKYRDPEGVAVFLHLGGFEPEGSWQHAGGMLQPEVACAAAQVESLTACHVVADFVSFATAFSFL